MKRHDILLEIIDSCGPRPDVGKTSLQKLAYFVGKRFSYNLEHRAHYYGPFSEALEGDISLLAASGYIVEKVEALGFIGAAGFPARRYEYDITEAGADRLKDLKAHYPELEHIQHFVQEIETVAGGLDQQILSAAAKTYFIAEREGGSVSPSDVKRMTADYSWKLSKEEIERVTSILVGLGFFREGV